MGHVVVRSTETSEERRNLAKAVASLSGAVEATNQRLDRVLDLLGGQQRSAEGHASSRGGIQQRLLSLAQGATGDSRTSGSAKMK